MPTTEGLGGRDQRDVSEEAWLRRQAVQLAGQLPEDPARALEVIRFMRELVEGFLTPSSAATPRPRPPLTVVREASVGD